MVSQFSKIVLFITLTALTVPVAGLGPSGIVQESGAVFSGEALAGERGDVDGSGRCDIFDLLVILRIIVGTEPYRLSADLDTSGGVDVFDLLAMLQLLAEPESSADEKFLYQVVFGGNAFGWPTVWLDGQCDWDYLNAYKIGKPSASSFFYAIYSNKQIAEVFFVLGNDTLRTVQGYTGALYDPDTLDLESLRESNRISFQLPWRLNLVPRGGGTPVDTAGISNVGVNYCFVDGFGPNHMGLEINFPLVLKGPDQRFNVLAEGVKLDTFAFDLNPERADSVMFGSIDSLVSNLRQSIDSLSAELGFDIIENMFYFSPAISNSTQRKENRLMLIGFPLTRFEITPLDGNETLLAKLGYPAWYREIPPFYNYNYHGEGH